MDGSVGKELAAKPEEKNSMCGTHTVEGENCLILQMSFVTHTTHTHTN